jgi:2-deoxy-D-gluconate 3-dehydrogenase
MATKMFDLTGKAAIVTGGNGGIGLGMAEGLAAAGAAVVVAGRNAAKNKAAVETLAKAGGKAIAVEADVTVEAACKKLAAETVKRLGRIDILVNNAGINIRKRPEEYSFAEWQEVMRANLDSAFLMSQAVYPHMKKAGQGKIVCIGSMTTIFGAPFVAPYSASKGGIVQMARSLATAWAKDNIQVNSVLPGFIDTDLTRQARKDIPGIGERVVARTPAGRWGVPADLAGVAVFLASAASDFVTGTAIPVDGGFSVQML